MVVHKITIHIQEKMVRHQSGTKSYPGMLGRTFCGYPEQGVGDIR